MLPEMQPHLKVALGGDDIAILVLEIGILAVWIAYTADLVWPPEAPLLYR